MNQATSKRIILNAVSAAVQVVVVGLMYFFLYKYLIKELGPAKLGIWALVISTSSIANFANFGITSGLVKFVADFKEKGDAEQMHKLIFTAFLSIVGFFAVLIMVGYLCVDLIIHQVIEKQYIGVALQLLPYALLCLFLNEIGGVYTSILEGFQKNYLRNIIYISMSVLFLLITYLLVPRFGLMGVAYAQVIQSAVIFVTAYVTGTTLLEGHAVFKWNWDKKIFKQLINYGSKFQLVSLLQILFEPTTKTLLTRFGGLAAVGYYEMASRLVNQVRALIVNANQVMIPVVAQASHKGLDEVRRLYLRTMSVTLFINVPLICAVICFSGYISLYWIGHVEPAFTFPLIVLAVSMFFNIMCGPAYFSSLGQGKLNLLVYIHLFMAVLNVVLGFGLGYLFSANGVILSWGTTFGFASVLLIFYYQRNLLISARQAFSRSDILLFCAGVIFAIATVIIIPHFNYSPVVLGLTLAVFLLIFLPLGITNPNLKALVKKGAIA